MKPYIDIHIQKNTPLNRQYLLSMVKDAGLAINASVVYIYALVDETINYPDDPGHVIYIGEAGRPTEPTGKRFAQHISTSETQGNDSGTIYSLSRYYWRGKKIRLQVFLVDDSVTRKTIERKLISAHVKKFGALPICQGTTGGNYSTTLLSNLDVAENYISFFLPPVANIQTIAEATEKVL
ncbi:hypothetical protein [Pseudomonas fulva]|uniref:hypothetical protein n=1 Tax=Pseudomonas fulva TaxID=47880 RepID=UPI003461FBAF